MDRRLVEEHRRRVLRHGEGEQHQLPLAERQLAGVAPEQVAEAHPLDRRRHGRPVRRPRAAQRVLVRQPPERDHLLDPHRERQRRLLGHDRQPSGDLRPLELADRRPAQLDAAGRGSQRAGEDPQQRRLAGAVRAHERDPLARADGERDVAQDRARARPRP